MYSLMLLVAAAAAGQTDLLPPDGRWLYPHYLTFRPGDAQVCDENPPRFSWPYVPNVLQHDAESALGEFTFQLSRDGDFARPELETRTPYNFYNALPVLEEGSWYWRVGYGVGSDGEQWSPVRSFQCASGAVRWDRTCIEQAVARLARQPHPRLAPQNGDWLAWKLSLEQDARTSRWLSDLLALAERTTRQPWWNAFPKTDRRGESEYDEAGFAAIGNGLAAASFAYRLTGEQRYRKAKDLAVELATWEKGGLASPEYHGASRKWPTQLTEYLAVCYDLWYSECSEQEKQTLLESLSWRLRATFLEKYSWASGDTIAQSGIGRFCQSHPYENTMWSLPGVLLTAGDLDISDQLTPLCLHYLTGVTSAHGPDEGWNEGLSYGSWKGETMLRASIYTTLLLPELELGRNPCYRALGRWYRHLLPLGIDRLAFGDYAADPDGKRAVQRNNFRYLAWLTGDGTFAYRAEQLAGETSAGASSRPWVDLLAGGRLTLPEPDANEPTADWFAEAGWVMAGTGRPSSRADFQNTMGMIFKCRPRGGFSHSYRSENDFVWYAFGQTLSAGGGGTAYPDPHSRHSLSHNVVLIDGVGQQWNPRSPEHPWVGRIIAYTKADRFTHWVGDATYAYQTVPGLLRCQRHVVLLDDRWFVLFDDLAMRTDADPATFSWLYHVAPQVPLEIAEDRSELQYTMGKVRAVVAFAPPRASLEIVDLQDRDGYRNPLTGEDLLPQAQAALQNKGRDLNRGQWMAHNVWVTNRQPARQWGLLAVLAAVREDEPIPAITFPSSQAVRLETAAGSRTVSFDPDVPGDVSIDLAAVRAHAEATAPTSLPCGGPIETVVVDGDAYRVRWLARETFDAGLTRWAVEGDAEVRIVDGRLQVRKLDPARKTASTIWFRPQLPADVMVRFRAQAIEPVEGNAANLNLFLHARELDGTPVRFGRQGSYKLYHEIPNYIVTLTGGCQPGWSRVRRDPGFHLLHEADVRSDVGQEYALVLTFQQGRLRYYMNGQRLHDVTDPNPLSPGRFALRTWSTNGWWDDVEFGQLISDHETPRLPGP